MWLTLLHPFWKRAPLRLRRRLIWLGSDKFLVGVAMLCVNPRGELLLLEHRFHNEFPWGLPGGWADRGESPLAAVLREVREETGLEPLDPRLLRVHGDGTWVEIVYACQVAESEPTIQQSEMSGYRWVDPAHLPFRLTRTQYAAVQEWVARQGS